MIESFKKNRLGISLICLSALLACVGQLFWKISANKGTVYMLIGFCFYGLGALIMIIAYKFGSLSVLQPFLSLNYVLSIMLAATVLKEPVTISKVIGILIIITGVMLIGGGDNK